MRPSALLASVPRSALARIPVAAGIALALAVSAALAGHGVLGVLAGLGTGAVVAGAELITVLSGPRSAEAYRLPGYRRPAALPGVASRQAILGILVLIMVLLVWLTPGWLAFSAMLLAGIGLSIMLALAYRRRGRAADRVHLHESIAKLQPRFVIHTGRRNDASYQLSMWIPVLERLQLPYLVVLRHHEALASTVPLTKAPVLVLPSGSDLDVIMVPSLAAAFYVNGVGENSTLVNYRQLQHVYLGHGDSDKELSVHPMHAMFDKIFVAGQAAIDRYRHAGVAVPADKFVIVGRPQLSSLAKAERPIAEINPQRVLYAPTWRGYNANTTLSSLPIGTKIITALLDRGAVINFRPHPFSWLGAGERSMITAIDDLLAKDRQRAGRSHRLAAEHRAATVAEDFDASDAMITDIGSVLVDFFATGKPYAVVLPPGEQPDTAQEKFPSTAAAYLMPYGAPPGAVLDDLLTTDPLAGRRPAVAAYYLGDHPGDDTPFLAAARTLLTRPRSQ